MKVWINAGHGGNDPGAVGTDRVGGFRTEADNMEQLSRAVGGILSGNGVDVLYTKDVSPYMSVYVPAENGNPADLFVSFHQNWGSQNSEGFEGFVSGAENAGLSCARILAEKLSKIWELRGNTYGAGVKSHTETAVGSLGVITGTVSPAVLFEYGFINNPDDLAIYDDNFWWIANQTAASIMEALGGNLETEGQPTTPSPSPVPSPDPASGDQTYSGEFDPSVQRLQHVLNSGAGAGLLEDGISGPITYSALQQFTVNDGDDGELIRWVQERLNILGYEAGDEDGYAGPITMGAIERFQRHYGLGIGYLGGADWYHMIES